MGSTTDRSRARPTSRRQRQAGVGKASDRISCVEGAAQEVRATRSRRSETPRPPPRLWRTTPPISSTRSCDPLTQVPHRRGVGASSSQRWSRKRAGGLRSPSCCRASPPRPWRKPRRREQREQVHPQGRPARSTPTPPKGAGREPPRRNAAWDAVRPARFRRRGAPKEEPRKRPRRIVATTRPSAKKKGGPFRFREVVTGTGCVPCAPRRR